MIVAKSYESVFKFVNVMPKMLWLLFFHTRCIYITTYSPSTSWECTMSMNSDCWRLSRNAADHRRECHNQLKACVLAKRGHFEHQMWLRYKKQ